MYKELRSGLNHTARQPATCIAGRLAEIITLFVYDHSLAEDRIRSFESQPRKNALESGDTLFVRLEIAEVAGMVLRICRGTMLGICRIKMPARGGKVRRGTIPFLVDVETMLAWCQPFNVGGYPDAFSFFQEGDLSLHFSVGCRAQDSHRFGTRFRR